MARGEALQHKRTTAAAPPLLEDEQEATRERSELDISRVEDSHGKNSRGTEFEKIIGYRIFERI